MKAKRLTYKKLKKTESFFSQISLYKIPILVTFIGFLIFGWIVISQLTNSVDINKITSSIDSCYYEQVQCFREPCEPILVCPPSSTIRPRPTSLPNPSLQPGCYIKIDECPMPPCKPGTACIEMCPPPKQVVVCPSPVPTPNANGGGLGSFRAQSPCSVNSYRSISYSCNNSSELYTITSGTCGNVVTAMRKAMSMCGGYQEGL